MSAAFAITAFFTLLCGYIILTQPTWSSPSTVMHSLHFHDDIEDKISKLETTMLETVVFTTNRTATTDELTQPARSLDLVEDVNVGVPVDNAVKEPSTSRSHSSSDIESEAIQDVSTVPTDIPLTTTIPFDYSVVDVIANRLYPSVTPALTLSVATTLFLSNSTSTLPTELDRTSLLPLWRRMFPSVDASELDTVFLAHHLHAASHNAELQRIEAPIVTGDNVTLPVEPHFPIFTDEVPPPPSSRGMSDTALLHMAAAAEDVSALGRHTLHSDRTHASVEVTTPTSVSTTRPGTCAGLATSAAPYGMRPQPLLVLVASADAPIEAVPRAVRALRARCPFPDEVAVFDAPVTVALPPVLAHATGALAALLHGTTGVEVVVATEHRGSLVHALNEVVRARVQRIHAARVATMDRSLPRLRFHGVFRVLVAHLAALHDYADTPVHAHADTRVSADTVARGSTQADTATVAASPSPSLDALLTLLAAPTTTTLSPRMCLTSAAPVSAAALGLSTLPLHAAPEALPRGALLVSVTDTHTQGTVSASASASTLSTATGPAPGVEQASRVSPLALPYAWFTAASAAGAGSQVEPVDAQDVVTWQQRASPSLQAHLCAALLVTMHAPDDAPLPQQAARPSVATLVRYNSLPLPSVPALTLPALHALRARAQQHGVLRAETLLLPLGPPGARTPQRVAVFAAADTSLYAPPGFGQLGNAPAAALRGAGPGYSVTALVGLRAEEVVRWGPVSGMCGAAGTCSQYEEAVYKALEAVSAGRRAKPTIAAKQLPFDPLRAILAYTRALSASTTSATTSTAISSSAAATSSVTGSVSDGGVGDGGDDASLPVWPHAPRLRSPLLRLRDGRCLMSQAFEAAVAPARTPVPLALATSAHLRGTASLWGFARVAAAMEALLDTLTVEGCTGFVLPSDLPRSTHVVTPQLPHRADVPFPVTRAQVLPLLVAARDVMAAHVGKSLSSSPSVYGAAGADDASSTPHGDAQLPPVVLRLAVLVPTLGGNTPSPLRGSFLAPRNGMSFQNDNQRISGGWSTTALNGLFPARVAREQSLDARAAELASSQSPRQAAQAAQEAERELQQLQRSPLGTLVESVRDGMLLTGNYYQNTVSQPLRPRVMVPPPVIEVTVWVGYDAGDSAWDTYTAEQQLQPALALLVGELPLRVRLVRLQGFRSSPNWIWNALAQRAYDDGHDAFLQVNDDVTYHHKHWLPTALHRLTARYAPGVGVVGLYSSARIFTQLLFARRHVELSGGYSHPLFRNWFGDDYVSYAYGGDRELNQGLMAHLSNNVFTRYDTVRTPPTNMSALYAQEQARVVAFMRVYAPAAAARYEKSLLQWAGDNYRVYIDSQTYERTLLHAY